jgi:hypothetical protein
MAGGGRVSLAPLLISVSACVLLAACAGPPSHAVPPEGSLDALVPKVIEAIDSSDQAAFAALFADQDPDGVGEAFDACDSISPEGRYRPNLDALVPYLFTIYLSGVSRQDGSPRACMLHLVWDDHAWTIEGNEVEPSAVPTPAPGDRGPY